MVNYNSMHHISSDGGLRVGEGDFQVRWFVSNCANHEV